MKIKLKENTKFNLDYHKVQKLIKELFEKEMTQTEPKKHLNNQEKEKQQNGGVSKPKGPRFPMDYILFKFPNIKTVLTELLTTTFRDYIENIYVVAPKPTTFKVLLKNKQDFLIIYNERSYIVKVSGKKYYLLNLGERERAIKAVSELLNSKRFITSKSEEDESKSEGPDKEKGAKLGRPKGSGGGSSTPSEDTLSDLKVDDEKKGEKEGEELPELPPEITGTQDKDNPLKENFKIRVNLSEIKVNNLNSKQNWTVLNGLNLSVDKYKLKKALKWGFLKNPEISQLLKNFKGYEDEIIDDFIDDRSFQPEFFRNISIQDLMDIFKKRLSTMDVLETKIRVNLSEIRVQSKPINNLRLLISLQSQIKSNIPKEEKLQLAIKCAELVLPIWNHSYPNDDRPKKAIQAAKDYLEGKIDAAAASTAATSASAAGLATSSTLTAATFSAAYAANYAATSADYDVYANYAITYAIEATKKFFKLYENKIRVNLDNTSDTISLLESFSNNLELEQFQQQLSEDETTEEISPEEASELINNSHGALFTVEFEKRDGSHRVMNARLGVTKHLKGGSLAYTPSDHDLIPVFDMQQNGYRMVNKNSIKALRINKKNYTVKKNFNLDDYLGEIQVKPQSILQKGGIYRFKDYGDDEWRNNYKYDGIRYNYHQFLDLEGGPQSTNNLEYSDEDLKNFIKDNRIEKQKKLSSNSMGDIEENYPPNPTGEFIPGSDHYKFIGGKQSTDWYEKYRQIWYAICQKRYNIKDPNNNADPILKQYEEDIRHQSNDLFKSKYGFDFWEWYTSYSKITENNKINYANKAYFINQSVQNKFKNLEKDPEFIRQQQDAQDPKGRKAIQNIEYYQQLVQQSRMSPKTRDFVNSVINSIKQQRGFASPNQLSILQRLKLGQLQEIQTTSISQLREKMDKLINDLIDNNKGKPILISDFIINKILEPYNKGVLSRDKLEWDDFISSLQARDLQKVINTIEEFKANNQLNEIQVSGQKILNKPELIDLLRNTTGLISRSRNINKWVQIVVPYLKNKIDSLTLGNIERWVYNNASRQDLFEFQKLLEKFKRDSLNEISLDESRVDFLKDKFVGKVLDDNEFNQILDTDPTQKKLYTQWLINIYNKDFKERGKEITDFMQDRNNIMDKIEFFEKNKSLFPDKDINHYSLPDLNQTIDHLKKDLNLGDSGIEALSPQDINKLQKVGMKYLGEIEGYQIVKIPKGNDSPQTHKVYANIICQGRTHICTASNYTRFQYYLLSDDMYILLNPSDPESPYHVSKFTDQVSTKNDKPTNNQKVLDIASKLK